MSHLLDLFTGTGSVKFVAEELGYSVTSVDFDPRYIGRHHYHKHASAASPVFPPPETSVIAAGRAEGGGAHLHRDADCGAAQAANRRRERKGELRASASLPRGRSSSACTTHPAF